MRKLNSLIWMLLAVSAISFMSCSNAEDDEFGSEPPAAGTGAEASPYSVTEAIALGNNNAEAWVKGYIVGHVVGKSVVADSIQLKKPFTAPLDDKGAPLAAGTNLLLAASANETNIANFIVVQLPAGVLRTALELVGNQDNLGKEVQIKGKLSEYFKVNGLKGCTAAIFDGKIIGNTGETGEVDVCGEATGLASYSCDFTDAVANVNYELNGWRGVIVKGDRQFQGKTFDGNGYVQATAHDASDSNKDKEYETWLISPALDLTKAAEKVLSFELAQAFWKETSSLDVYVLQCVNNATVKTKLEGYTKPAASSTNYAFASSGKIDLSQFSGVVYIGFCYKAIGGKSNSTTWCVDNFVFGQSVAAVTTVSISSNPSSTVYFGKDYEYAIKTSVNNSVGATVITCTGMPSWLALKDNGDGTAALSGIAPSTVEASDIIITATNNNVTDTQSYKLTVKDSSSAGSNLISNGSFEDWVGEVPSDWTIGVGSKDTTVVSTGAASVVFGSSSSTNKLTPKRIHLDAGNYTWSFKYFVEAGQSLSLRYWAMSYDDETTTSQSAAPGLAALKSVLQNSTDLSTIAGTWVAKTVDFTVPAGGGWFVFELRSFKGTTGGYIDDVVVEKK